MITMTTPFAAIELTIVKHGFATSILIYVRHSLYQPRGQAGYQVLCRKTFENNMRASRPTYESGGTDIRELRSFEGDRRACCTGILSNKVRLTPMGPRSNDQSGFQSSACFDVAS